MTTAAAVRDPKAFVDPDVWDREIKLLVRDHPFDTAMAERLFAQAIAYLITAMERHGQRLELVCGEPVDSAVHAFIVDTRNYREFCHRHFDGRFLEHIPEIELRCDGPTRRTAEMIEANGFQVDWPLWEKDFSTCTPCHPGSYGVQGMYANGFTGRQVWIYRWACEPSTWADLLILAASGHDRVLITTGRPRDALDVPLDVVFERGALRRFVNLASEMLAAAGLCETRRPVT